MRLAHSVSLHVECEATLHGRHWVQSAVVVVAHLREVGHRLSEQLVALGRRDLEIRELTGSAPGWHTLDGRIEEGFPLGDIKRATSPHTSL